MEPGNPAIRVAIIGLGVISVAPAAPASAPHLGHAFARSHAAALANIPGVSLVAGCDLLESARASFEDEWRSVWPDLRMYNSSDEMLDTNEIDLLIIATPDHVHEKPLLDAIGREIPMVMIEKPLATSLASADKMISAVEAGSSTVAVDITRHWYPTYQAALGEIEAGAIGEVKHINVNFGGPRAMLWRNHTHMLDMMNQFARSNPVTAYAELEPGMENYGLEYRGQGGSNPDLEPGLEAMFSWENGVRGHLLGMKDTWANMHVEVVGSEGRITVNDNSGHISSTGERGVVTRQIVPQFTVVGIEAALRDLISSHANGTEPACTVYDARKPVAMIDGVLRSQAEGNRRVEIALPSR